MELNLSSPAFSSAKKQSNQADIIHDTWKSDVNQTKTVWRTKMAAVNLTARQYDLLLRTDDAFKRRDRIFQGVRNPWRHKHMTSLSNWISGKITLIERLDCFSAVYFVSSQRNSGNHFVTTKEGGYLHEKAKNRWACVMNVKIKQACSTTSKIWGRSRIAFTWSPWFWPYLLR